MLIGNDIIDLQGESRTFHPRFPRRILSDFEWEIYNEYDENSRRLFVWQAWAVKEAAYKAYRQLDENYIFSAQKIVWDPHQNTVAIGTQILNVYMRTEADMLHAICSDCPLTQISTAFTNDHKIKNIPDLKASEKIRLFFAENYFKDHIPKKITWNKTPGGMPIVFVDNYREEISLSFSHHGRYLGYAYILPKNHENKESLLHFK